MKNKRAFTLAELLIASLVLTVVMVTIYASFRTGLFGYRNIEETINTYQAARQILERLNLDLRNSFAYSGEDAKFKGTVSELSFMSLADTFSQDKITQSYSFVSYSLNGAKLTRSCRKDKDSLNEKSETQPEEMPSDIGKLEFSYGVAGDDGALKFQDSWAAEDAPQEKKKLPAAVKVKLTLRNKMQEEFERTIYLTLAQ